ncbi:MAG: Rossmann-like domain-containing protein [Candidatus Bipolaricaulota bacterium]
MGQFRMLTDELIDEYRPALRGLEVVDLRIGLGYTAVKLSNGDAGVAATLRYNLPRGCSLLEDAGQYMGTEADKALQLIKEPNALLSGIGLATLNAIVNRDQESNAPFLGEALDIGPDDEVAMVGYFEPLIEEVRKRAGGLKIFEREMTGEDYVYPDWSVDRLLPECDVSIISSTTLINGTIDHLLELTTGRVGLLGPSTPMSPILSKYGISHLFGSVAVDPDRVMEIVSQAGGTRNFGDSVRKVNLKI